VANQEELGEGDNEFNLSSIFVDASKLFSTCRKILRHGASHFTFRQKKGVLRIFITRK
jgi:hypothetical protein